MFGKIFIQYHNGMKFHNILFKYPLGYNLKIVNIKKLIVQTSN